MYKYIPSNRSNLSLVFSILVFGFSNPAYTQPVCGDTITSNDNLTGDLNCSTSPALTLVGPAKLNMRGYTLTCSDDQVNGIVIEGSKGKLHGGTITGCLNAVLVAGDGRHHVIKMSVHGNSEDGINIESDNNKFTNNTAINNDDGFDVDGGNGNRFVNNNSSENSSDGFDIDTEGDEGGNDTTFINNRAFNNEHEGFCIDGNRNLLLHNIAIHNGTDGFDLDGVDHKVRNNFSIGNGNDGFIIKDNGNKLTKNVAIYNDEYGIIIVDGADNNVVTKNRAKGNTIFDLADENLDCANNTWNKNRFGTSNMACID